MINYLNHRHPDDTVKEIVASVYTLDEGLRMSIHPLYHTVFTHDQIPDDADEMIKKLHGMDWLKRHIEWKIEALDKARDADDWSAFIFLHERPYRCSVLDEVIAYQCVDVTKHPQLIREVWVDTENSYQHAQEWNRIFGSLKPADFNAALTDDEQAARALLPDVFPIYRGYDASHGKAAQVSFSWTLNKDRAQWFASRLDKDEPAVVEATIMKEFAVGPMDGRGEDEILLLDPWTYKNRNQLIITGES
jgi:hypothetical protein